MERLRLSARAAGGRDHELIHSAQAATILTPTALDPLCVWWRGDHALVYVPFGPADRRDLVPGVEYSPRFRNDKEHARLEPADGLIVSRAHEER